MRRKREINGLSISPGHATGFVYRPSKNIWSLKIPYIILLDDLRTDNVMEVLKYPSLAGIISKAGGFTSHGASILRESGIPGITLAEKDIAGFIIGLEVVLDAYNGKIRVIEG